MYEAAITRERENNVYHSSRELLSEAQAEAKAKVLNY